ncbi:ABC-2 family transporter protein [soil metagenome]
MKSATLCLALIAASIRGQMQYRLNFLIDVGFGLMFQSMGFVFIWIVVGQFEEIGGWSLFDIMLLYGMRLTSHGLWLMAFSRLYEIDQIVREGEFDRMLVRPMPMMLQVMFSSFRIATLGDLLGGVALLAFALSQVSIEWTAGKAVLFVAALVGGAMLDGAFQLGPAALTFRTLTSWPLRNFFDDVFNRFGSYPASIFNRSTRSVLLWVIPVAFMAWTPATVLLDRTAELPFPVWLAWFSPLAGIACLTIAAWLFMRESRYYQSSGS